MRKLWTKQEEELLQSALDKANNNVEDVPIVAIAEKIGKTPAAVKSKAFKLKKYPLYEWDRTESRHAFELYLLEKDTGDILEILKEAEGTQATLPQLEKRLMELRWYFADALRAYAKANDLWQPKNPSLKLLKVYYDFRSNPSLESKLKEALHG